MKQKVFSFFKILILANMFLVALHFNVIAETGVISIDITNGTQLFLSGGLYTRVDYSPDSSLKTGNYLRLYSSLNVGKASWYLYTCYEGNMGFEQQPSRKFSPFANFMSVRLIGKLHPAMQDSITTLGHSLVRYSPYILTINYDYAAIGQGIAVDNIKWKQYDLSMLNFFEPDSSLRYGSIAQGMRIRGSLGSWQGEVIAVRHLQGNPTKDGTGRIINLGPYDCDEFDLQYIFQRSFGRDIKVSLMQVEQNVYKEQKSQTTARKIDIEYSQGLFDYSFGYRYFEPGFSPRYRHKIPQKNEQGLLLAWNPVERYKNQKGFSFETSGFVWGHPFELSFDQYSLLPEGEVKRGKLLANLEWPLNTGIIYSWNEKFKTLYSEISFRRELMENENVYVNSNLTYIKDADGRNNGLRFQGSVYELALNINVKKGPLARNKFECGIQRAGHQNYHYLQGQVTFFNELKLTFGYRTPQITKLTTDFWVDDFERLHYRDQFVSLETNVNF